MEKWTQLKQKQLKRKYVHRSNLSLSVASASVASCGHSDCCRTRGATERNACRGERACYNSCATRNLAFVTSPALARQSERPHFFFARCALLTSATPRRSRLLRTTEQTIREAHKLLCEAETRPSQASPMARCAQWLISKATPIKVKGYRRSTAEIARKTQLLLPTRMRTPWS